jgi:hypothetical protein
MAVMMTEEALTALTREAIDGERERIIRIIASAGAVQALAGDLDGAQIMGEVITLIQRESARDDGLVVTAEVELPVGIEAQPEIETVELPPVVLRTDDEDVAAFLRKPRMPQPLPR